MERVFRARRHIDRPPETLFDFVADHRNVSRLLEGVTRWEPLSGNPAAAGARYDVEMSAGGLPLSGVLVLDRWRRPGEIGWVSESGPIRQRGRWRFRPERDGTSVELSIAYEPPGGPLAALVAGPVEELVEGLVRRRLEQALERMRDLLEERPGA